MLLIIASLLLNVTTAWGTLGHQTTGLVAQPYLTPRSIEFIATFLDPEYKGQLRLATVWADQQKFAKPWSRKHHYVQSPPSDREPQSCGFDSQRDCPNGNCVVGALLNYTRQLECRSGIDLSAKRDALKFLMHYVGDITQPLHACKRAGGGNGSPANFHSRSGEVNTELHSIWDRYIPVKRSLSFGKDASTYADFLIDQINDGAYTSQIPSWIESIESKFYSHDPFGHWDVAIDWATDTNGFDCSAVWPAYDADPAQDLSLEYYENSKFVVDIQIAKAGVRLAALINRISEDC